MKLVSAEKYDRRLGEFRSAYDRLSPDAEAVKLYVADRVRAYVVESENFESIHNHSAYAMIEHDKEAAN